MSLNHEKWTEEYGRIRPIFVHFTEKLKSLLKDLLEKEGIEYHLIEARAKRVPSFKEKISRPGKHYTNPLKEITDLSGVRILVYYLNDVDKVAKLIENEFAIDWANSVNKGDLLKPHEFGYRSLHYTIALSDPRRLLPEWGAFKDLQAEIQVRTVLQHAWAAIDQALRYKKESDVPSQLRRKLFRLSGLLELADEEFSSLRDERLSLTKEFRDKLQRKDTELEINVITLHEYIKTSVYVERLVKGAQNLGATVHPPEPRNMSDLVTYCNASKISKIGEINSFLKSVSRKVPKYFERLSSHLSIMDTNVSFLIIYLLIPSHPDIFSTKPHLWKEWNPVFLKDMLKHGKSLLPTKSSTDA